MVTSVGNSLAAVVISPYLGCSKIVVIIAILERVGASLGFEGNLSYFSFVGRVFVDLRSV